LGRLYKALGDNAAAQKELAKVNELQKKAEENLVGKMSTSAPPLNPSQEQ
jgi:hypothetical protein